MLDKTETKNWIDVSSEPTDLKRYVTFTFCHSQSYLRNNLFI